jgi:carboxypeptidase C (cathepsin A)
MYIPNFANQILKHPENQINLKGILIGNGAMKLDWNWRRMVGDKFY